MSYLSTHEGIRAVRLDREQVSDLLSRYPRVSDHEARQILTFLRKGRHLDVGLLTSNDQLRPRLDAFVADHKTHFRLKWVEGAMVVGGIIAFLVSFWLMWEALG